MLKKKLTLKEWPSELAGLRHVLDGVYDAPGLEFDAPPKVLDLGANIGAFAVWAANRWPGASVECFEPHPALAELLRKNVEGLSVEVHEAAVVGRDLGGTRFLYDGPVGNPGMNTLHRNPAHHRESGVDVKAVEAQSLHDADVLKVDTEGCEREIIDSYLDSTGKTPSAIMIEWHTQADYQYLLRKLRGAGYALVSDKSDGKHTGEQELVFVRRDRLPKELVGIAKKLEGPREDKLAGHPSIADLAPASDEMDGWGIVAAGYEVFVGRMHDFDRDKPTVTLEPYYCGAPMQLVAVHVPGSLPNVAPAQSHDLQLPMGAIFGGRNIVRWTSVRPCKEMPVQARVMLIEAIRKALERTFGGGKMVNAALAVRG